MATFSCVIQAIFVAFLFLAVFALDPGPRHNDDDNRSYEQDPLGNPHTGDIGPHGKHDDDKCKNGQYHVSTRHYRTPP